MLWVGSTFGPIVLWGFLHVNGITGPGMTWLFLIGLLVGVINGYYACVTDGYVYGRNAGRGYAVAVLFNFVVVCISIVVLGAAMLISWDVIQVAKQ